MFISYWEPLPSSFLIHITWLMNFVVFGFARVWIGEVQISEGLLYSISLYISIDMISDYHFLVSPSPWSNSATLWESICLLYLFSSFGFYLFKF